MHKTQSIVIAALCIALLNFHVAEAIRRSLHQAAVRSAAPDSSRTVSLSRFPAGRGGRLVANSSTSTPSPSPAVRLRSTRPALVRPVSSVGSSGTLTMREAALRAENGIDTEELAEAVVASLGAECDCDTDEVKSKIKAVLDDPKQRKAILDYEVPKDSGGIERCPAKLFHGERRLLGNECSPANSLYCAYCVPGGPCRNSGLSWCQ